MTGTRKKAVEAVISVVTAEVGKDGKESEGEYPNIARVPYIRYPITLRKNSVSVLALFDSGSEVNAIHPTLAQEQEPPIRITDIEA